MKVKFENEMYPEGTEFDVGGMLLINGETVEFDQEQLDTYFAKHGRPFYRDINKVQFAEIDGRTVSAEDKADWDEHENTEQEEVETPEVEAHEVTEDN